MYSNGTSKTVLETVDLSILYGNTKALDKICLKIYPKQVTSVIGPSGCGKSTLLRCFNRMNELIPNTKTIGKVFFNGSNIYSMSLEPTDIRLQIGMVFQKPNPFPKSIYDNVAFGIRMNNLKRSKDIPEAVEKSLKQSALWDEVKDRLKDNALSLSGGQQQRLCIARALAVEPKVILMDEPASALDPISTQKIEELIMDLSKHITIVIVTHNMQQANRISDNVAVMMAGQSRIGQLIEFGTNEQVFGNPLDPRTEAYVTGRIG